MDYKELMDNAELIAANYDDKQILDMSKDLPFDERMNFSYKIECIRNKTSYQESFAGLMHREKFTEMLVDNDELDYIIGNIDKVIYLSAHLKDVPLDYLKKNIDRITPEQMSHIEDAITHATSIFYPNVREGSMEKLKKILYDTAKETGGTILDIRNWKYGCYSKTFRINSRVVKVGHGRDIKELPQSNRILYPYFKGNVGADYVEVNDYIENVRKVDPDRGITEEDFEDIYEIYKDVRDEGLIWVDAWADNFGTVTPEQLAASEKRKTDLTDKGIIPNPGYVGGPAKNKLIIDLDFIVFEDDEYNYNKLKDNMDVCKQMVLENLERRYQEEKAKEKQEGHSPLAK